jgi:hypothetical protein
MISIGQGLVVLGDWLYPAERVTRSGRAFLMFGIRCLIMFNCYIFHAEVLFLGVEEDKSFLSWDFAHAQLLAL